MVRKFDYSEAGNTNSSATWLNVPTYIEKMDHQAFTPFVIFENSSDPGSCCPAMDGDSCCVILSGDLFACAGGQDYNFGVSSSSVIPSSLTNGSHIGYSRVKESIQGETAGYSVYEYYDQLDYQGASNIQGVQSSVFPAPIVDRVSFTFGLPYKIGHYNSDGVLVQEITNSYRKETICQLMEGSGKQQGDVMEELCTLLLLIS